MLRQPYYRLDEEVYDLAFRERIVEFLKRIFKPFTSLFDSLYGVSPALAYLVTGVLFLVLVALLAHILYTFRTAFRPRRRTLLSDPEAEPDLARLPATWETRARDAVAAGAYADALRFLLRAALLRLAGAGGKRLRRATTNREYLRRYRRSPAYEPLACLVDLVDRTWYGNAPCDRDVYRRGEAAHARILGLVPGDGDEC